MPRSTKDLTGPAKISAAGQKDQLIICQPSVHICDEADWLTVHRSWMRRWTSA